MILRVFSIQCSVHNTEHYNFPMWYFYEKPGCLLLLRLHSINQQDYWIGRAVEHCCSSMIWGIIVVFSGWGCGKLRKTCQDNKSVGLYVNPSLHNTKQECCPFHDGERTACHILRLLLSSVQLQHIYISWDQRQRTNTYPPLSFFNQNRTVENGRNILVQLIP